MCSEVKVKAKKIDRASERTNEMSGVNLMDDADTIFINDDDADEAPPSQSQQHANSQHQSKPVISNTKDNTNNIIGANKSNGNSNSNSNSSKSHNNATNSSSKTNPTKTSAVLIPIVSFRFVYSSFSILFVQFGSLLF